jgi:hypothetical protein
LRYDDINTDAKNRRDIWALHEIATQGAEVTVTRLDP